MPKASAASASASRSVGGYRRTARRGADLAAAGIVPEERIAEIEKVAARYAMALTPAVLDLIEPVDPADPIARQYVPSARELESSPGESIDPIGDESHSPVKGVVHRYPDRVLLTPILHCPVYCRFCFRRERVGGDVATLTEAELSAALDYVRQHEQIWEVIVTGGDPLMLPPERLRKIVRALDEISHVAVIRFHSRVPVSDPQRVSTKLVAALQAKKAVWAAIHCNHPRELAPAAEAACRRLADAGIPLLGQTVLLKGINDDVAVMESLLRAMVRNRIKPYYLHHLDLAPGTGHFRTGITEGRAIMRRLRGRVSGLCQPSYVLDIPGGYGKVPIGPDYLRDDGTVEDWQGACHPYPPRG
ncbi:MAG TPA: lysine-2,3-aminomutase-like protein [Alphaproteobacteria bacterium]|nr:lysine-2,3-aminomutase-like protein [Alphaproteobacteria bacterium]